MHREGKAPQEIQQALVEAVAAGTAEADEVVVAFRRAPFPVRSAVLDEGTEARIGDLLLRRNVALSAAWRSAEAAAQLSQYVLDEARATVAARSGVPDEALAAAGGVRPPRTPLPPAA